VSNVSSAREEYRLREATAADGAAVRALVSRVLAEYGLPSEPTRADADLMNLDAHYRGAGGWFAVLEAPEGGIVGSVGWAPHGPGTVELRKMYLDAAHRGRGLGRRLLEAALASARAGGARRVTLETATVLGEAVRLYERAGFRRAPEAPQFCRCDLVMVLDLA